jgi:hypothetical protein
MAGSARVSIVLVALANAGCADLPPIEYETEHLRIATDSDAPLCQGSLDALESHVAWVEDALDLTLSEPVEVYLSSGLVDARCEAQNGNVAGCYSRLENRVFTDWASAPHELVHAIAAEQGSADEFFAEGTATAFGDRWTEFGTQAPTLGVGLDVEDVSYNAAGHFVRWAYERDGAGPLREILHETSPNRGPDHAHKAFEKVYGRSLLDAEIEFLEQAPERYPSERQCLYPTLEWSDDRLEVDIELDCSASNTWGDESLLRAHTIDIPDDGHYVLEVEDPAHVMVRVCQDSVLPRGEPSPPDPASPVGEFPGAAWFPASWISPGAHDLYLFAGRYRIDVRLPSDGTTRFRLHRKLGGGTPGG